MAKSSHIHFFTQYDPAPDAGVACTLEERMTKSEFAAECDINLIMARYERTGILPEDALAAASRFGDFSQVPTFQEMQDRVIAAHELFDALPAAVRKTFDNDPGEFIAAADSEEGRKVLISLGLGNPDSLPSDLPSLKGGQPAPAGTEPAGGLPEASSSKKKREVSE